MPQINILNILQGDNQSTIVDKINYNFDQILSAGGGPQGQQGLIGPSGPIGPQGAKGVQGTQGASGTKWFVQETAPVPGNVTGSNPWTFPTIGDYWMDPDSANQSIYVFTATGWVNTGYGLAAGEIFQKVSPINISGGATGPGILIGGAGSSGATATTVILSDASIDEYTPGGSAIDNLNYEGAKLKISTRNDRTKILSFGRSTLDVTSGTGAGGNINNPSIDWTTSDPKGSNFYGIALKNPGGSISISSTANAATGGININANGEITAQTNESNIQLRTLIPNKGVFLDSAANGGFVEFSTQLTGSPVNKSNAPFFANSTGLGLGLGTGQFKQSGDDSRRLAVLGNTSISKTQSLHTSALFLGTAGTPNVNKGNLFVEGHVGFGSTGPTGDLISGLATTGMSEEQGRYPQLWVTSPNYGPGLQVRTKGASTYTPRTVIGDGVWDFANITGATAVAGTGPDLTQEFYTNGYTFTSGPLISYQHKISSPTNTKSTAPVFSISTYTNAGAYSNSTTVNKTSIRTTNSNKYLELMANGTGGGNTINLGVINQTILSLRGPSGSATGGVTIGASASSYPVYLGGSLSSLATFITPGVANHSLVVTGVQTIGTTTPQSLFNLDGINQGSNLGGTSRLKIYRALYTGSYLFGKGSTYATGAFVNNYPNGLEITSHVPDERAPKGSENKSVAIAVGAGKQLLDELDAEVNIPATGFFVSNSGENIGIGQYIDDTAAIGVSGAGSDYAIKAKGNISTTGRIYGPIGTAALPTFSFTNDTQTGMYLTSSSNLSFATEGKESLRIWRNDPYATELLFYNANNVETGLNGSLRNWGERLEIAGWSSGLQISKGFLDVATSIAWTGPTSNWTWFSGSQTGTYDTDVWTPTRARSITTDGDIHAVGLFVASSDIRIKENLEIANSKDSLDIIKNIEVTKYSYKDKITKGNGTHTKVIAQQIKEFLPEAVTESSEFIPNIYSVCKIISRDGDLYSIKLENNIEYLEKSEIIRIVDKNNKSIEVEISDHFGDIIIFDSKKNHFEVDEEIFVYGKKVSDFLSVDYDNIMCVNISATQELSKIIETQKEKIDYLEDKLSKMEEILSRLMDDKI